MFINRYGGNLMGKYTESNLIKNERVVLKAKKSFIAVFPHFINFLTSELAITDKRVIGKVGLIRTHSVTSSLNKIQNVTVSSGLIGKIFNYGTIKIETAGSEPVKFYGIKNPEAFKKAVFAQMELFDQERVKEQAMQMAAAMSQAINR